jgi:hypothetical protein
MMPFLKNIFTDLLKIYSSFFYFFNILNLSTIKSPILKFDEDANFDFFLLNLLTWWVVQPASLHEHRTRTGRPHHESCRNLGEKICKCQDKLKSGYYCTTQ